MREVRVQGSDAFVIRSVSVLPESIPAGFSVLAGLEDDESLLIVDLGGTTLDVSHVRSKMTGITKTRCDRISACPDYIGVRNRWLYMLIQE